MRVRSLGDGRRRGDFLESWIRGLREVELARPERRASGFKDYACSVDRPVSRSAAPGRVSEFTCPLKILRPGPLTGLESNLAAPRRPGASCMAHNLMGDPSWEPQTRRLAQDGGSLWVGSTNSPIRALTAAAAGSCMQAVDVASVRFRDGAVLRVPNRLTTSLGIVRHSSAKFKRQHPV